MPLRQNACLSAVYMCAWKYPAEPAVGFEKPEEALWGILSGSGYGHWMLNVGLLATAEKVRVSSNGASVSARQLALTNVRPAVWFNG
ncbi:GD13883 [Drosophila simulans]|uniref:GD13883 n=1 Tax=Drosophila simulans TaxID=7240 RepID=B4QRJ2_DROSI|nr:GD13883 [Drosophila simulans]